MGGLWSRSLVASRALRGRDREDAVVSQESGVVSPRSDQCRLPLADLASADVERVIAHGLELALVVARLSPQLRPPVPVPKGLRPLVQFAKLPASARPAVRRVLEEDEEFRGRVAVITDEAGAPRAAWLFLHRPDGWADELAALVREAVGAGEASEAGRAERGLQRRLTGAETALARADEALAAARKEGVRAAEELAGERRARRSVEEHRDALTQRLGALEEERDAAGRRAGCVEVDSADLRRQLGAARAAVVSAEGARERAERQAAAEAGRARALEAAAACEGDRSAAVASSIADAAAAALALGGALGAAAAALGDEAPGPGPQCLPSVVPVGADHGPSGWSSADHGPSGWSSADHGPSGWSSADHGIVGRRSGAPTPSRAERVHQGRPHRERAPQPLPPALFDDSREAAEHLVRVPDMVVLVDGYNATMSAWSGLPIARQRARLIDACAELAARAGTEVLVVFDGAEEPRDMAPQMARRGVRWRFSPVDVEADDVLLDLVAGLDPARPVMVASSDLRVRDGARSLGANAISTSQLFALLRRDVGGPGRTTSTAAP